MMVRLINNEFCRCRSALDEFLQIFSWRERRRWVVRVTDIYQSGAGIDSRKHAVKVMRKAGSERYRDRIQSCGTAITFDRFKSWQCLEESFAVAEKRESGHPENFR